jgi:hypothetical protein
MKIKIYLILIISILILFLILFTIFEIKNKFLILKEIRVDYPKENQEIRSPLIIKGKAKGIWFFEAEFNVELYDENNNLLGNGILKAKSDWMTENFVPFEGELIFKKPETRYGKLVFLSNNPSGIAEYQKVYIIPVEFENINYQKTLLYYYNLEKDKDKNNQIKCSEDGLTAIQREIPVSQTPIKDTINLLLKGKENLTQKEIEEGISTEYPLDGFSLKALNLKSNGTLILEFNDPNNKTSGGSCRTKILWLQIEKTAKQFNNVLKVEFEPKYLFQP